MKKYQVTGTLVMDYVIIVDAENESEATYAAELIDLDIWHNLNSEFEVTSVVERLIN